MSGVGLLIRLGICQIVACHQRFVNMLLQLDCRALALKLNAAFASGRHQQMDRSQMAQRRKIAAHEGWRSDNDS